MASVTYIEFDGTRHELEVPSGQSVMQGAVNHGVRGIVAECGGGLSCATCHCYLQDDWIERVPPPAKAELEMLEVISSDRKRGSRLSCQITVSDALHGLVVHLPESQY